MIRNKKVANHASMDVIELTNHLRQEHLLVSYEKQHIQKLNEKVVNSSSRLFHLFWIVKQQKFNLDRLILSHSSNDLLQCCLTSNALESVNFVDGYKRLGQQNETFLSELFMSLRKNPQLIAHCLINGEKTSSETIVQVCHIVMSTLYSNCILNEDKLVALYLLKELFNFQLVQSENPRRLIRHGSCAFSKIYKLFCEQIIDGRIFLTAALHDGVMHLLAEDDLLLEIDPNKAVIRIAPQERLKHFGQEGTPSYDANLQKYRQWIISKLTFAAMKFIKGIQENIYCFPQSIALLVKHFYNSFIRSKKIEPREIEAICADIIFEFFICPAIINPDVYGITDAHISQNARFNLMQVAQIIQLLAMPRSDENDPKFNDLYGKFERDSLFKVFNEILEKKNKESVQENNFGGLIRSWFLISDVELKVFIQFLQGLKQELQTQSKHKMLSDLLERIPEKLFIEDANKLTKKLSGLQHNASPNPSENHSTRTKKGILNRVTRRGKFHEVQKNHSDEASGSNFNNDNNHESVQITEVIMIPFIYNQDVNFVGMLSEEKVLEMEQQKRHTKVRMNLDMLMTENANTTNANETAIEKRTRFFLSQDQESIGTSDNLEAISEAASNHSVDLENETDNMSDMGSTNVISGRGISNVNASNANETAIEKRTRFFLLQDQESIGTSDNLEAISEAASNHSVDLENENDNMSDMVSANVSSGRGTPNVSGRDTPSSHSPNHSNSQSSDEEVETLENAERAQSNLVQPSRELNTIPVTQPNRPNNTDDIEDKFGKFDIKPVAPGDETKSMLSDTWSTDVLASDSEAFEQQDALSAANLAHISSISLLGFPSNQNQSIQTVLDSETASQSDAWSTDVLTSDTERMQEFDVEDNLSITRSDDMSVTRSEPDEENTNDLAAAQNVPRSETDDILDKYRTKPTSESNIASTSKNSAVNGDSTSVFEENSEIDENEIFNRTKRKIRKVLGGIDLLAYGFVNHSSKNREQSKNDLVKLLKVMLSEAINLKHQTNVVLLNEALRSIQSLNENECQKLFWALREDYQRRSKYIAYLTRSKQQLLSTLAFFDSLLEHIEHDKFVCSYNLISILVRQFLDMKEKNVQIFIKKFQMLVVSDEKAALVQKFLEYLFSTLESDSSWQGATEEQTELAKRIVERHVMSQIYMMALYPNGDGDVLRDQILYQHIENLSRTISPSHKDLGIPKIYHSECPWPSAQAELTAIVAHKTPRDKVRCVFRCCTNIMNLLSLATDRSVPAADDLMPVLVYVLIKANPVSLLSTVQYVNSFYEKNFEGEEGYWWTQFCSAVEFIKNMD